MTCIVAAECKDGVVLAGDFCGSNGWTRNSVVNPKVFNHNEMFFGFTGSFRFGQVLEHCLCDAPIYTPMDEQLTYSWLVRDFIPKLSGVLRENEISAGDAIIVLNNQVWHLQSDLSVLRYDVGMASVGSGSDYALSSLFTMKECLDLMVWNVEEVAGMIKKVFEITARFVPSVSSNCEVLKIKKVSKKNVK